ncbi:hypothetical protein GCG54_00013613 [Colletotrichum gloeosporioides]|uniref:Uncharacterized protein n=1 Tax=Colletotrichum gloeosporioides TaxID=474922 RepID=A0A8H4FM37_COLGL|nr:uncharacterized protein GCG54_00013613 [Colletotrichum gloeosporioides]KAF3805939.1 hypothetical protein GCG54_00013613 [Colletotrichum gloeosporioides]
MTSDQSPTKLPSSESTANDITFEVHSNLVSSTDLLDVLTKCFERDKFAVEMRHSIFIIKVKQPQTEKEKASLERFTSGT